MTQFISAISLEVSLDILPNMIRLYCNMLGILQAEARAFMNIVLGVLHEEYNRLQELAEKYRQSIGALPKGVIQKKIRRGRGYVYLSYRAQHKVVSRYIGKEGSPEVETLAEKIERRKSYEQKLKQVRTDLKELQKALHGRARNIISGSVERLT